MSHELHTPEPSRDIRTWPLIAVSLKRCWAARDDLLRVGIVPVILDFLIMIPLIGMLPLTGTSDPVHMQQDLAIGDLSLTPVEMATIEASGDRRLRR